MRCSGVRQWILMLGWACAAIAVGVAEPARAQYEETPLARVLELATGGERDERRDAAYEIVRRETFDAAVVEVLANLTKDSDRQVRFLGLLGLAHAGPRAASPVAIEALLRCLRDADAQVRFRAADALGKIGTVALPQLIQGWESANSQTRIEIARAIGVMGPPAKGAAELLTGALQDSNEQVRRHAAYALLAIAPDNASQRMALASHADPEIRCMGLQAIGHTDAPTAEELALLERGVDDSEGIVREMAVVCLARSAVPAERKLQVILARLKDSEPSVRAAALAAIEKADVDTVQLWQGIATALTGASDAETARTLLLAMRRMPSPPAPSMAEVLLDSAGRLELPADEVAAVLNRIGPSIVPQLLAALEERPQLQPVVSTTLASFGDAARDAIMECTTHGQAIVRHAACAALENFAPSPAVMAALRQLLEDADDGVRAKAVEVAGRIEHPSTEVRTRVVGALQDSSPRVRAACLRILPTLGLQRQEMESLLRESIDDPDASVRLSAVIAAGSSGAIAALVDVLPALLQDDDLAVRVAAIEAAAELSPDGLPARVRELVQTAIRDRRMEVRSAAIQTAAELHMNDPETVAALMDSLREPQSVLVAALQALAGIGEGAKTALPSIAELLHHDSPTVRTAAVRAIAAIDGDTPRLVARLTETLDDSAWEVRQAAAERLAALGAEAKAAVPKLFGLLANEEDSDFASGALREIDAAPQGTVDLFVEHLDSPDRRTAYFSIYFLGKLGADAKQALPELQTRLKEAESGPNRSDVRARFLRQAIESIEGTSGDSK